MMYQYCRECNIPHANLGKLLVATSPDQVRIVQHVVSVYVQQSAFRVEVPHACANNAFVFHAQHAVCIKQSLTYRAQYIQALHDMQNP